MKCRSFTSNRPKDVRRQEENVYSDDYVSDEFVGQLGDQFVAIGNVVTLILKRLHVFAQNTTNGEVGQRFEDGPVIN